MKWDMVNAMVDDGNNGGQGYQIIGTRVSIHINQ